MEALAIASLVLTPLFRRSTFAADGRHHYKLAPECILPADIRMVPPDVREAYRFAVANRDTLFAVSHVTVAAGLTGTRVMPHVT